MSHYGKSVIVPNPRPAAHGCNPVELTDGRIALCWFAGTREGVEDQRVLVSTSVDGVSWSEPELLVDHFHHEGERWIPEIAALLHDDRTDSLWAIFSASPLSSFSYRPERDIYVRELDDARLFQGRVGRSGWRIDQPAEIPSRSMILQGKPVARGEGSWLIQGHVRTATGRFSALLMEGSPSGGWTETRHIVADPGCLEPSTALFSDGLILTYLRYPAVGGHIWRCESSTDIASLSVPVQTTLRNPHSGIDISVTADDLLLVVYNDSYRLRTPLTLGISADRGATFRCHDVEVDSGEFSYPKLFRHSSGRWYVFYTHNRKNIACLEFDPDDLKTGRPVIGLAT